MSPTHAPARRLASRVPSHCGRELWFALLLLVATLAGLLAPAGANAQCRWPRGRAECGTCVVSHATCTYAPVCGINPHAGDTVTATLLCSPGPFRYQCSHACSTGTQCATCAPGRYGPACAPCPGGAA